MLQLAGDCFDEICNDPAVSAQISSLDTDRRAAVRRFWAWMGGALLAVTLAFLLFGDWAWIPSLVILVVASAYGGFDLLRLSEALKQPVLAAIAAKAGLEYVEKDFSPPVFPEAREDFFGSQPSDESFSDLFHGRDEQGRAHSVYEAVVWRGNGRGRSMVFKGQIYTVERGGTTGATIHIVPDRGLWNFLKPNAVKRVKIESDPEFEKKYEVYATEEMAARELLFDSQLRRWLLEMRATCPMLILVAPDNVMVAASTGINRFEPGSMFASRGGEDRVRTMIDDVCQALATLRTVKAKLG